MEGNIERLVWSILYRGNKTSFLFIFVVLANGWVEIVIGKRRKGGRGGKKEVGVNSL